MVYALLQAISQIAMLLSLFDDSFAGYNTLYDLTLDYLILWICGPF